MSDVGIPIILSLPKFVCLKPISKIIFHLTLFRYSQCMQRKVVFPEESSIPF